MHLDPGPTTTPIASTNGNKPIAIPRKPPTPIPAGGGPQPSNNNPSTSRPKYYRQVKAQIGRGRTHAEIKTFAITLAERYPDELEDILASVQMAIAERAARS
jgi:hypothetical protein